MKIYIDTNDGFKCYPTNTGGLLEYEESFFDGKCPEFIKGYRLIPAGEKWILPNGIFLKGLIVVPWKDHNYLQTIQEAYERGQDEILTMVESALEVGM